MTRISALRAVVARMLGFALLAAGPMGYADAQTPVHNAGEVIYRHGILPSGEPLIARREPSQTITGAAAACINCHRRSGFGEAGAGVKIPPISGAYLFRPRGREHAGADGPAADSAHAIREPYTDASVARAIREGLAVDGRSLSYLMPRYTLSDADLAALIGYLKVMTPVNVPGVTSSVMHFATIVTPDADPAKRKGMLDVLEHYFAEKNASVLARGPPSSASQGGMGTGNRRWQLHVWELNGAPASWDEQLRRLLAREPVFAVISGVGGATWAPIHRFCEQAEVPCLFPNVDLPEVAEQDFYPMYFSRGVLLEADLIARRLADDKTPPVARRIVQVFRDGDVGAAAAKALGSAVTALPEADRPRFVDRLLDASGGPRQLANALRDVVDAHDVLVLWLRPADLASLPSRPAGQAKVFVSGLMGGLEQSPLPEGWRAGSQMTYPVDLPIKRAIRVDYALGWFRINQIPPVAEQVQTDTWLACKILGEILNHIPDVLSRDAFVEHEEGMLENNVVTGYYPRLALAPKERFASKGGYVVHFAASSGAQVTPDTDWLVP